VKGRLLAAALAMAAAAWAAPLLALRFARPAVVNFGPNDGVYAEGFREGWEREGHTRFHWTTTASTVRLPLKVSGDGHVVRMRLRRHFVEPARVTLRVEGRPVAAFDIQADTRTPYRVLEFALSPLAGRGPFALQIHTASAHPSPLGVAMDWLEVERRGPGARFALLPGGRAAAIAVVLTAFAAVLCAGGAFVLALACALALLGAILTGLFADVLATERILRDGWSAFVTTAVATALLARAARTRRALGIASGPVASALTAFVLCALAVRLVLLLHPGFFYPDVRVHAMFAWQLARHGLDRFLSEFTASQFRYSLGLQYENGHWYAFPYPPLFYLLCWPLVRLFRMAPEVAVSLLAAVVNSFETLLVYGIARRLRLSVALGVTAAAAVPLLPIFLARLSLAYFPALVGHFVDTLVIAYLLARLDALDRPRTVLTLAALLALALLTYTQSLLNFGILLPLFLLAQVVADRAAGARRRQLGLLGAGALGVTLSLAVFYGRYIPVFLDMQRGVPMAEEQILLDQMEARARLASAVDEASEPPDDPYAGPGWDLLRGLRKAGWRLYVFYGLFAPILIAGVLLLARSTEDGYRRFVCVWAVTYVLLNLASGGLPGPNLVRYNKDLEVVAPLCCLALASVALWLATLARPLALLYATGYWWWAGTRAARYLTEKFVLER
jgi:hypothetical protein